MNLPPSSRPSSSTPGADRLRAAIARSRRPARKQDPCPYDDDWGWWIETRLARLEKQIRWLLTLAAGALFAEVLRLALTALGLQ
jgi:hypothetical protein